MEAKPRNESSGGADKAPSGRPLAITTAVVFVISAVFPIAAGLSKHTEEFPKWWGPVDVAIAFVLAALSFAVLVVAKGKISPRTEHTTYRAYRVLIHGVFVMGLVFVFMGDRVIWA